MDQLAVSAMAFAIIDLAYERKGFDFSSAEVAAACRRVVPDATEDEMTAAVERVLAAMMEGRGPLH